MSGKVSTSARVRRLLKPFLPMIFAICTPLLALPLVFVYRDTEFARPMACAFAIVVMGVYWVFEIMPIPVTALMPVFLFPMLGIVTVGEASSPYFSSSNFLFFGGLVVALSVEEVNLHKRLALKVLMFVGSDPKWIMLGVMMTAWFLSMWMSNTATTAMMLPIAIAVIEELTKQDRSVARSVRATSSEPMMSGEHVRLTLEHSISHDVAADDLPSPNLRDEKHLWKKSELKLAKAMLFCLCHASNIGGTATLTGTVPNIIAAGQLKKYGVEGITFANWMAFQVPTSLIFLILTWLWLHLCFFPFKSLFSSKAGGNKALMKRMAKQYKALGSIKFGEVVVLALYFVLVALWILREPQFMPGWGDLFRTGYVSDAVPVMLIAVILFVVPREIPCFSNRNIDPLNNRKDSQDYRPLMTWDTMKKFPWDVVLILGGGFSLAFGVGASGLSTVIAAGLHDAFADSVSPQVFLAIVVTVVTFFTNVTSNASTANIFIPILISLADGLHVHPFYLAIPVAISCSLAFMMPIATPPNAIVFGAGVLTMKDMMVVGFVLNWLGIGITLLSANYVLPYVLGFEMHANATAAMNQTTNILMKL